MGDLEGTCKKPTFMWAGLDDFARVAATNRDSDFVDAVSVANSVNQIEDGAFEKTRWPELNGAQLAIL